MRNDRAEFERLVHEGQACITMNTFEEDYALGLVRETALRLGRPVWLWSAVGGVQDGMLSDHPNLPGTDGVQDALAHFAQAPERSFCVMLDSTPQLQDARTLRAVRNVLRRFRETRRHLVLIDWRDELPQVLAEYAARLDISLPDDEEIEEIVRLTLRNASRERPIEVSIKRSALNLIIRNLRGLTRLHIERIIRETIAVDRRFEDSDLNTVLARKRQLLHRGGLLEYVETPVDLAEIGGFARLKTWLQRRAAAFSDRAEEFGLTPPRGVLLLGVQGAGKSLCAKAIATAWRQPLLRMDVGALYDRYIGESERRLRESLRQTERMAPTILWIDEIEKAFASAASRSTDGGLSQRMFGTLLTWMQEHQTAVFIVATANDIEALPPELLRKGRFDEIFFIDLPQRDVRREIFAIHLRKRRRDPAGFDLDALAEAAAGYSGAEIEAAVLGGLHEAFATDAPLATEHVLKALAESPPLSETLAERVAALREWAAGRCVPAD